MRVSLADSPLTRMVLGAGANSANVIICTRITGETEKASENNVGMKSIIG